MNYDVFLSHNGKDKPAVEQIGRMLSQEYGLSCWLDKWNLIPGEPWQEALEEALDQCKTVAVFVGPNTISPWENEEMRSMLETRVHDKTRRVIPVLLPGAPDSRDLQLPRFLSRLTWVDFRSGLEDKNALYRLSCGIQGVQPGADTATGDGDIKGLSRSSKAAVFFERLLRKRHTLRTAIALVATILVIVLAVQWLNGDLFFDVPLFCGKEFSSAPGYINLATEQRNQGRLTCAIQNLEKGLSVDPSPTEKSYIYYKLASVFIVKLEPDPLQALKYADLGLEINAAYQDLLYLSKGIAKCELKQNVEAVQEFNKYLDSTPNPSGTLANTVKDILADLEKGEDMRDVCKNKLGVESLP